MDVSGMTNTAVASGNILAMKKAMDTQENLMLGVLAGMVDSSNSLQTQSAASSNAGSSAPQTGVNTATDGGLDVRI